MCCMAPPDRYPPVNLCPSNVGTWDFKEDGQRRWLEFDVRVEKGGYQARCEGEITEPHEAPLPLIDGEFPTPLEPSLMVGPKKGHASSLRKFARRKRQVENAEATEPRDDASTVLPESTVKELTHASFGDGGSSAGHSALVLWRAPTFRSSTASQPKRTRSWQRFWMLSVRIWQAACITFLTALL